MQTLRRTLSIVAILVAPMAVSACSSDGVAAPTTEVVVAGAPLMITNPALVERAGTDVVIGTIQNVTDRTIEVTSVSSSVGDLEFRSADGSLLATITIDPNSDLTLDADRVHIELAEPAGVDAIDVVFGLDIQDDFDFTAVREEA